MNSPFAFRSKATYEYCLDQRCDGSHYCLFATLTDRQLQFWEDVEEGLNDVADCYASRGENIDRIRRFAMRLVDYVCVEHQTIIVSVHR